LIDDIQKIATDIFYYNIPVEITKKDCEKIYKHLLIKVKFVQKYFLKEIIASISITILNISTLMLLFGCLILPLEFSVSLGETFSESFKSFTDFYIQNNDLILPILIVISLYFWILIHSLVFLRWSYFIYGQTTAKFFNKWKDYRPDIMNKRPLKLEITLTPDFIKEQYWGKYKYNSKEFITSWSDIKEVLLVDNFLLFISYNPKIRFWGSDTTLARLNFIIIPQQFVNSKEELVKIYQSALKQLNNTRGL